MDFFYKYKTFIFLTLFSLFSIFLAFILYSLFFKSTPPPKNTDHQVNNTGGLPSAKNGEGQIVVPGAGGSLPPAKEPRDLPITNQDNLARGGITKTTTLSNLPGSNFTTSPGGSAVQYYNKYDGKFYKLDKDGHKTPLSEKVFYNVKSVAWAHNKNKAVIEYPDGANIVYDFKREKQITLPKYWEDFDFAPNDKQIVTKSIGLDPGDRWLAIANSDGSGAKYIEPLGTNADRVYSSWSPSNQSVAMFTEGVDLDRQKLYFVGQNQENFKATIIEGRGFQPLWNKDGTKLLYSVYSNDDDLKPSLWVVNAQGESIGSGRQKIGLLTWASKCSFSNSNNLYCAVPQKLKKGAGLFPDLANNTTDAIYKVNIQNGLTKLIAIPDQNFTISNITVSGDEKTLFFVDKKTELVHKIDM